MNNITHYALWKNRCLQSAFLRSQCQHRIS
jgi:hypothetical protein